ncbi:MAG TPA: DUF4936 family protein [Burkholderiales bacterium]|nr:DUF4936 family protein [Burkholderiales bacterium]
MAYSYYVYYRVEPDRAEACETAVLNLLDAVKQATGVAGRLLKKRAEPLLWMEVYESVRDDAKFESELATAAARLKLGDFLKDGTMRRVECFEA